MNQTKITVKIYEPLLKAFNEKIEDNFIKRDAFLNHMLKSEVSHLAEEMKGLKLSGCARRYISGELKRLGTKTINVVVDKETSEKLQSVVKQTNMVRDAFVNRLILLLLSPDGFLEMLDLPNEIEDKYFSSAEKMPTSPMKGIESIVFDPLFYLRLETEQQGKGLYLLELSPKLMGLSCYINNSGVPGTDEYKKENEALIPLEDIWHDSLYMNQRKEAH